MPPQYHSTNSLKMADNLRSLLLTYRGTGQGRMEKSGVRGVFNSRCTPPDYQGTKTQIAYS